jgi:flagellum-specific peptidoglycan hydrolase FlgJ
MMTKMEFISRLNQASNEAFTKGALFNKTVIIAQAALESNWGNSELSQRANNLFSIKAGNSWNGETVWLRGTEWHYRSGWSNLMIEWRKYPGWTECVMDYAKIIAGFSWYQDALQFLDDADTFLKRILPNGSEPGWATDPEYYHKILKIASEIESYGGPKWNKTSAG